MKIPLVWLADYVETGKSPKEIADSFTAIGLMLDKPVGEDNVLDLEQRLNRSDLLSVLGCARDFSVFENISLQEPKIKIHKSLPATSETKIKISVETPAVRRFNTRVFRGITVGDSPDWLKKRLELYGIGSINNIVDITNFVMLEQGQPMHAQDVDTFPSPEFVIRKAEKGERITTLLGTEITLDESAFVLASGGIPQVIGGIVGGATSGVTGKTKNIILDAGNYDPRIVRTASRNLKIMNETVSRYDKPLDPRLTEIALNRATDLILELAGGTYYENYDYYPEPVSPQSLSLSKHRLDVISGEDIPLKSAKTILTKLGYAITEESDELLTVEVPYYRTDVDVEDDLISDILRMRNYNTIVQRPLSTPIPRDITPAIYRFEEKLRDIMISVGAHEHITTQLVSHDGDDSRIQLENALSVDQNALRMSARETLTDVVTNYRKNGVNNILVFEIGKSFIKPHEEVRELVIIDTRDIRETIATVLQNLGIAPYSLKANGSAVDIMLGDRKIGDITTDSARLDIQALIDISSPYPPIVAEIVHKTVIDLSLSLPQDMLFEKVADICRSVSPALSLIEVVEEYEGWKLVRLTWSAQIQDIDKVRSEIINRLKAEQVDSRSG